MSTIRQARNKLKKTTERNKGKQKGEKLRHSERLRQRKIIWFLYILHILGCSGEKKERLWIKSASRWLPWSPWIGWSAWLLIGQLLCQCQLAWELSIKPAVCDWSSVTVTFLQCNSPDAHQPPPPPLTSSMGEIFCFFFFARWCVVCQLGPQYVLAAHSHPLFDC